MVGIPVSLGGRLGHAAASVAAGRAMARCQRRPCLAVGAGLVAADRRRVLPRRGAAQHVQRHPAPRHAGLRGAPRHPHDPGKPGGHLPPVPSPALLLITFVLETIGEKNMVMHRAAGSHACSVALRCWGIDCS